ncbi:MAG: diacylglycerol kinase [Actinomycetota bacterium]|nr:diacylglycerol kinase [Actinomycetota bacterium]
MKNSSFVGSLNNAIEGVIHVLEYQRNIRVHFIAAFTVLALSLYLGVSRLEFMLLLVSIALVLSAELINTAIEETIDLTIDTHNDKAKIAKDVAAGAVLITSVNAIITAYFVFFPLLERASSSFPARIRRSPIHLTITAFLIISILIVAAKALTGYKNYIRGGWPSGHTALAFSALTAIAILGDNMTLTTLAFILAALVSHSRVQAGIHSWFQVFSGAIGGFLVTVLMFQAFYF